MSTYVAGFVRAKQRRDERIEQVRKRVRWHHNRLARQLNSGHTVLIKLKGEWNDARRRSTHPRQAAPAREAYTKRLRTELEQFKRNKREAIKTLTRLMRTAKVTESEVPEFRQLKALEAPFSNAS